MLAQRRPEQKAPDEGEGVVVVGGGYICLPAEASWDFVVLHVGGRF